MRTFLVNYVLRTSQYMESGSKTENKVILIEALDEAGAKETLEKYWDKKSDNYGTSYVVCDSEVAPTISQIDF